MSVASEERAALVHTLRTVGPDAPTVCPGWTTRQLVAHLIARERRPDALLGIGVPRFAERRHRIETQIAAGHSWPELVDRLASGPPPTRRCAGSTASPTSTKCLSITKTFVAPPAGGHLERSMTAPSERSGA